MARPMRFSTRVGGLGGRRAAAWDIHTAASAARARGEDIILLSVGDPDFDSPASVVEAAVAALRGGDTHYSDILGRPALRAAIARGHARRTGHAVDAENVIVLAGAQNGLFSASLCLFDAGDEVLTFDPMYLTYEASIRASGATPITVPQPAAIGFRPDLRALAEAIGPRTRAIWFANPSNPTGVVFAREELEEIAALARRHDLWVVVDEVYASLTFDRPHVGIAELPGMAERTVTIGSLSKSHAMTGWRIGWIVAPEPLVGHLYNLALCMLYGLPGFIQEAACAALEAGEAASAPMRETYRARRDLVCDRLGQVAGLACLKPEAGMFTLVDVRGTGLSAYDFSWALLREAGVSVLDAGAFGQCSEGFVRLALTVDETRLAEACDRIARFAELRAGAPSRAAE
ncbi:MAG: aminotransferase class I/II-fold pyridoxal phosphate-dependent enzyme [Methylobacteriaceae bacterium]|nr:aminotransferase class I/II-fold pyridoxal phosphate-dependent enzyme [Methylobacteriaceae bacterium]